MHAPSHGVPERHPLSELYGSLEPMAAIGTWRYGFQPRRLVWSAGLYTLLGLDVGTDRPSYDLFAKMTHPDDRLPIDDLGPYLERTRVIDRDFRIIRPNGSIRWVTHKAEVFVDKDRQPFMALGILLDITARVEATRARDAAEARLRIFAHATNSFTWVTKHDGSKEPCQGWMDLTGQTAEESSGAGWLDCVHSADRKRAQDAWMHAMATQSTYAAKYRVTCRDGLTRWVIARAFPEFDARGTLLEWYGVAMDITDVKVPNDAVYNVLDQTEPLGRLIKTARSLLDWSIEDLAGKSGVSISSIRRLEGESVTAARGQTTERLVSTLMSAGIEFCRIDDHGTFVRQRRTAPSTT